MKRAIALLLLLSGAAAADDQPKPAAPASPYFFQKNDRIVFLGDSITEQYQYSTYLELYLTTRFPDWNLTFLNAGISGDTANGGASRFKTHVLDEKPTAITINFGMNDGGYGKFNPVGNKVFVEKTEAMLKMSTDAKLRVALLSPNAVDRRNKSNGAEYVETQKQFYAPLAGLAEKHGHPFVDQYAITRAATDRMEKDDPKAEKAKPYYDGFHTSPPGGLLMAHAILTGLKSPAVVSDAVISTTPKGTGCIIDDVHLTADSASFKRTDTALPLPVQKDWLPMLPYMSEMKDLNHYGLRVEGLKDGNYSVSIDGVAVAKFTAKQLAEGVNLGNLTSGPVFDQANKVLAAINEKNKIVHGRFRGVVMYQFNAPDWLKDVGKIVAERKAAELKKRSEQIDAAQAAIYKLTKPVPRKFEVKPAE